MVVTREEKDRIEKVYLACEELLVNAPEADSEEDELEELYAEAANFMNTARNLGFRF